jgi:hypothetical protein
MKYTFPSHKFPFWKGYQELFKIKDFILPSDWINANFRLSTAYAIQGRVTLFEWQVTPVDAIIYFSTVIDIAVVQSGKSMMGEGVCAYMIDNNPVNMMFIYAKRDTVEDVFDERLKPMIKDVPAIRKYWSGYEDDLTKKKLKLFPCIIRIASAGLKTEIATHNAGFVYGSELAKWPKKAFSQTKAIEGRKQASRMLGRKTKTLYETSPEHDQDPSYIECHKPGTVWFRPHYCCPHCEHWQVLVDSQIKEKPDKNGKKDHNPERIKQETAAWYECENCKREITEDDRIQMAAGVKWLTKGKKIPFEEIIKLDNKPERAVFQWNRLVDTTWTFAECLAAFFDALQSPNPNDLKTYRNEDMAEWVKLSAKRFEDSYLMSKRGKYTQFGADAYIPEGVAILLLGVDTQDNGFYYVVRGFGKNLESWLIRADFILCDMKESKYTNPAEVFSTFTTELYRYPYQKRGGMKMPIFAGLIDRGGHRSVDIDYIVAHTPNLGAYIGGTQKMAPLIEQKKSGFYIGHTENLSRIVAKQIESVIWHLPKDIQPEYCTQVLNQYDDIIIDTKGNSKRRRTCKDPDHYRDCENMVAGLVIALDLQSQLFDDSVIENLEKEIGKNVEDKTGDVRQPPQPEIPDNFMGDFNEEMGDKGW